jgi:hypothetical protein
LLLQRGWGAWPDVAWDWLTTALLTATAIAKAKNAIAQIFFTVNLLF